MLIYILKSAACLAILLFFYKLFLEKENMHVFKRFYLLGSLLFALIVPTLVFLEYVVVEPQVYEAPTQTLMVESSIDIPPALEADVIHIAPLLWIVYFVGMLFFGIKFLRNLFQILQRIRQNPKYKNASFIQVLLQEQIPPHTFFKYIFLNKRKFESNEIPKEVLLHEETHARQKHSLDIIFIELLHVIFWINPLIYFCKKAIKLNHEFLADSAVIEQQQDTVNYQNTLLSYLSHESLKKHQSTGISNAINYSSIKKRFTIMKKRTSKKAVFLRAFLLLPLCVILLYGFSEIKYVEKEIPESGLLEANEMFNRTNLSAQNTLTIEEDNSDIAEEIPTKKNTQINATRKQMAEYNSMAKKYNQMLSKEGDFHIKGADIERLEYIYTLMSDKQKLDAEPFPNFPEPPPAPDAPIAKEYASKKIKEIIEEEDPYDDVSGNIRLTANKPGSPIAPKYYNNVPVPPPPQSPLDHVIDMAKKGAVFYFEGKEISSDRAIELLEKNKELSIETTGSSAKNPKVKISKSPIRVKKTSASKSNLETGNIKVNGSELFYSTKNGITSYFNTKGEQVDRQGKKLKGQSTKNPTFYFNGNKISSAKAHQLLKNNRSIQVATEDYTEDEYAIVLTDLSTVSYNKNPNKNNNPNSFIDLTEMIEKEASFFYNDKPISTEKALWLTKNTQIERVNTKSTKNGKPKVYLWKNN
ncbi:MAG: M56 family metallopeptidase [Flavobacteriaceae bacterium]